METIITTDILTKTVRSIMDLTIVIIIVLEIMEEVEWGVETTGIIITMVIKDIKLKTISLMQIMRIIIGFNLDLNLSLSIIHIKKTTLKVFHLLLIKLIIPIKDIKIETMEVTIILATTREIMVTSIEEEAKVEAPMVVIDLMDKEINIRVTEVNNQDMNHKENYHRLNSFKY